MIGDLRYRVEPMVRTFHRHLIFYFWHVGFFRVRRGVLTGDFGLVDNFVSVGFLRFAPRDNGLLLSGHVLAFRPLVNSGR